jgi:hypothetical protein
MILLFTITVPVLHLTNLTAERNGGMWPRGRKAVALSRWRIGPQSPSPATARAHAAGAAGGARVEGETLLPRARRSRGPRPAPVWRLWCRAARQPAAGRRARPQRRHVSGVGSDGLTSKQALRSLETSCRVGGSCPLLGCTAPVALRRLDRRFLPVPQPLFSLLPSRNQEPTIDIDLLNNARDLLKLVSGGILLPPFGNSWRSRLEYIFPSIQMR